MILVAGSYYYHPLRFPVYLEGVLQSVDVLQFTVFSMSFWEVRRQVQSVDQDVRHHRRQARVDVDFDVGEVFESDNEFFDFLVGEDGTIEVTKAEDFGDKLDEEVGLVLGVEGDGAVFVFVRVANEEVLYFQCDDDFLHRYIGTVFVALFVAFASVLNLHPHPNKHDNAHCNPKFEHIVCLLFNLLSL